MATSKTDQQKLATLRKLINRVRTAFMVTRSGDGMHGRPMITAKIDNDFDTLWFASARDTTKIHELKKDDHVYLGYTNSTGSEWASVNGRVRVVKDAAKAREVWNAGWKAYFKGPNDPNLVLLAVKPEHAEYWDEGIVSLAIFGRRSEHEVLELETGPAKKKPAPRRRAPSRTKAKRR